MASLTLDLSRFDAAPLIAFTATKETDYGSETDGRISPRCGAYRSDLWLAFSVLAYSIISFVALDGGR